MVVAEKFDVDAFVTVKRLLVGLNFKSELRSVKRTPSKNGTENVCHVEVPVPPCPAV
jgi:hypothetical protein